MKNTELRIGNWVDAGYEILNPYHQIKAADFSYLEDGREVNGIPLTPEILEKAGFVIGEDLNHTKYYDDKKGDTNLQVKDWSDSFCLGIKYGDKFISLTHIQHIHQLQNLYYALTGQELTITL